MMPIIHIYSAMKKDMKDNAMIGAALTTLASGIALCFLSFFLDSRHNVHSSCLWYFGQTLLYCASSFGLATYLKTKLGDVTNFLENDELSKRTFHHHGNDSERDGTKIPH